MPVTVDEADRQPCSTGGVSSCMVTLMDRPLTKETLSAARAANIFCSRIIDMFCENMNRVFLGIVMSCAERLIAKFLTTRFN